MNSLPQTDVQLGIVYLVRHSLSFVSWKQRKEMAGDLKLIYKAATETTAEQGLEEFVARWDAKISDDLALLAEQLD